MSEVTTETCVHPSIPWALQEPTELSPNTPRAVVRKGTCQDCGTTLDGRKKAPPVPTVDPDEE